MNYEIQVKTIVNPDLSTKWNYSGYQDHKQTLRDRNNCFPNKRDCSCSKPKGIKMQVFQRNIYNNGEHTFLQGPQQTSTSKL